MSVSCGFYNSLNHDRTYDATQLSSIFDGIIKDGIFMSIGSAFKVSPSTGMTVGVGEGKAWFNHTWTLNDNVYSLTIDQSEPILDRIDAIVLDVDSSDAVRDNSIIIVKGTPAETAKKPSLIKDVNHNQYALAYVSVKRGVVEITAADISNVVGTDETPFISGILETISADIIYSKWEGEWEREYYTIQTQYEKIISDIMKDYDEWFKTHESVSNEQLAADERRFNDFLSNLKTQLSGDVAGNLQNEIDQIVLQQLLDRYEMCNKTVKIDDNGNVIETATDGSFTAKTTFDGNKVTTVCTDAIRTVTKVTTFETDNDIKVSYSVSSTLSS
nr:MAG TPA: Receptor Binding Protein [Caudoviricetes sp.]